MKSSKFWAGSESHNVYSHATRIFTKALYEKNVFSPLSSRVFVEEGGSTPCSEAPSPGRVTGHHNCAPDRPSAHVSQCEQTRRNRPDHPADGHLIRFIK